MRGVMRAQRRFSPPRCSALSMRAAMRAVRVMRSFDAPDYCAAFNILHDADFVTDAFTRSCHASDAPFFYRCASLRHRSMRHFVISPSRGFAQSVPPRHHAPC